MNQPQQNLYVGNGKEINTQYGPLLKISFSAQELQQMLSMVNQKGYINLNVNRRQQIGQYGHTHSIQIDTWQPEQQQAPQQQGGYQQPPQPQYQQPAPQDNIYTQQPAPAPSFQQPVQTQNMGGTQTQVQVPIQQPNPNTPF